MSRKNDPNKPRPSVSGKKRASRTHDDAGAIELIGKHARRNSDDSTANTKRIDFADLVAARNAARQLEEERQAQQAKIEEALSSTASMEAIVEEIEIESEIENEQCLEESLGPSGIEDFSYVDEAFDSMHDAASEIDAEAEGSSREGDLEDAAEAEEAAEAEDEQEAPLDDQPDLRRSKVSERQKRRAEKKAAVAREKLEREEAAKAERAAKAAERVAQAGESQEDRGYADDFFEDAVINEESSPSSETKRKKRRWPIVVACILLAAAIAVACFAWHAHVSSMNSKIALRDDNLSTVLVAPEDEEKPYYAMVEVEYSKTSRYYEGPGLIALLRIDPAKHVVTTMIVPPNTTVPLADGKYRSISEAQCIEGDAYLVSVVGRLFNVNIAHVIRIDDQGLQHIVDHFGGIKVDVPEAVDDSDAGDIRIDAGKQTLDGASVVVLTKADNYDDPVKVRSANQAAVIQQLVGLAVASSQDGFSEDLGALKGDFKTDMEYQELRKLLKNLAPEEGKIKFFSSCIPGETNADTGTMAFDCDGNELIKVMNAVEKTGNPADVDEDELEKKFVYIEVRNGSPVEGAAVQVKKLLHKKGWGVSFTSNADEDNFKETLIVCQNKDYEKAAKVLAKDMGVGKIVMAEEKYEFGADILVIVGKDWKSKS